MVKVLRSSVSGPLEPYATGFAQELLRQGYSRSGAAQHVCFIGHLDRWLSATGVGLGGLSVQVIERYLAERRAAGYVQYCSAKALGPLLSCLAPAGVLHRGLAGGAPGPVEELLGRYRDYLIVERGLSSGTVRGYVDCVRPFIATRTRGGVLDVAGMGPADVTGFVLAASTGRATPSAEGVVRAGRRAGRDTCCRGRADALVARLTSSMRGSRASPATSDQGCCRTASAPSRRGAPAVRVGLPSTNGASSAGVGGVVRVHVAVAGGR